MTFFDKFFQKKGGFFSSHKIHKKWIFCRPVFTKNEKNVDFLQKMKIAKTHFFSNIFREENSNIKVECSKMTEKNVSKKCAQILHKKCPKNGPRTKIEISDLGERMDPTCVRFTHTRFFARTKNQNGRETYI